jgi:polyisoprenoid-binding protein YceI
VIRPGASPQSHLIVLALALSGPGAGAAQSGEWTVIRGELRAVCPLNVGGSIEARSLGLAGALALAPEATAGASFGGDLRLDLGTIDTGIDLRNRHLRENYLEIAKGPGFSEAVLSDLRLPETSPSRPEGKAGFTAVLLLHGVKRPVSGRAEIKTIVNTARVEARFPVKLSAYGIPPPRYLGVGVQDEIEVNVSLVLEQKKAEK